MQRTPATLALLLFVSGATALLLQVLWARDLALLIGATAVATAIVLFAFFAGLMLGAELGGRLARRRRDGRLFAVLELGVALATLAYLLVGRHLLHAAVLVAAARAPASLQSAARALLALAVLLPPTTLIGATLPAAVAAAPRGDTATVARLYAWNTLGGAAGALGSLLAIAALGASGSFLLAAALDATVALLAWRVLRAPDIAPAAEARAHDAPEPDRHVARVPARLAAVAALSGFAGLASEVLWTRGLAGVLSNSVYSVALVLAAVLLGLVGGAALAAPWARRRDGAARALPFACVLLAATTVASREALRALPALAAGLAGALRVGDALSGFAVEAVLGLLVVFAPALCLGAILPLCVAATGTGALGRVLALNTAGGLLGAPLAAFLLLPTLGPSLGLALCAALAVVAGLLAADGRAARAVAGGAAALLAVSVLASPPAQLAWAGRYGAETLLFQRDGAAATVLVTADARGGKRLLVNGQYSLGGSDGVLLERRQAYVPLLVHPAPRRVLLLGVGTGSTLGAALEHPDVRVDAVEILPEVLDAAALFAPENGDALADPRARVVVEDARTFLLASDERWDVVVSDLFLPWTAGAAYLYTRDMFALGASRLAPGGLYCQWLPLHQLSREDLRSIVATFADAFPHVTAWLAYHRATAPILALVGSHEPLTVDVDALRVRLAEPVLAAAVRRVGLDDPRDLALLYAGEGTRLRAATADAQHLTDDRPHLEFSAPSAYFHQPGLAREALAWLRDTAFDATPGAASPGGVSPRARAALLEAQLALLAGDGPGELQRYLEVLALEPGVAGPRRALAAIARSRRAAGDERTARAIADAVDATDLR